jgi:asparagine synthetase B (glutamine-hydrolysing)
MCGFVISSAVGKVLDQISHRGIRKTIKGKVGHVRLPIVGLGEENDQPVAKDKWIFAFVGELLDFRDEDSSLACDVDLVVRTWLNEGVRGFRRRDGFWSIAAYNLRDDSVHLLCDYLAQKPTYYRTDVQAAASELTPLVSLKVTTPDEVYFSAVAKWGYCPETQRTPHVEIKRVLPGEYVVIDSDLSVRRGYVDPLLPLPLDPQQLKEEITQAVRRRVAASDVPVACLLSGGLDSSIVYTLARRFGEVRGYFAEDPQQPNCGEQMRASLVAGSDHVEVIDWGTVSQEHALAVMQEPIDLGSLIPQVALSRKVAERVCLTGDGADEFFGGYGRASRYDSQASDVWHELVNWHLPRLDRVMMRNCVEVRSPFLARRVAGAALSLPRQERTGKKILRDLFRDDLPTGIVDAPKVPLRTSKVEVDREKNSIDLIETFKRNTWPEGKTTISRLSA